VKEEPMAGKRTRSDEVTTLELNEEERDILLGVLKEELGTVREEVYHADTAEFKDSLKKKEELLRALIGRLGGKLA